MLIHRLDGLRWPSDAGAKANFRCRQFPLKGVDMKRISYRAVLGVILLIIGVLLLLEAADVYDTERVLVYIPSLFVLLGIYLLVKSSFRNMTGPVVFILLFGTIQVIALDIISLDFLLPIAVIAVGLALLLSRYHRPSSEENGEEGVDLLAIFGGVDSRSTSRSFRGGEATAIFGSVKLDLRDAAVHDPPHPSARDRPLRRRRCPCA